MAGILNCSRMPRSWVRSPSLAQEHLSKPCVPISSALRWAALTSIQEQPGVLQLRRQAQAAAEDPSMPNRVSARALQTVLYAHFSGRQGPDVDTLLREMNLNRTTFDTLASHLTAFDFLDQEIKTPGKDNARPLKRVRCLLSLLLRPCRRARRRSGLHQS